MAKGRKIIVGLVLVGLVLALIWGVYYVSTFRSLEHQTVVTTGITINEVREIAQLSAVEYMQSVIMSIDDPGQKLGPFTLPGTKRKYLAIGQGTVGAGIDMNKISHFEIIGEQAIIELPGAEILYKYIMPETLKIWDEREGIFVRITATDTAAAQMAAEEEMVKKAIENGILETADSSVRNAIEMFLKAGGIQEVVFK